MGAYDKQDLWFKIRSVTVCSATGLMTSHLYSIEKHAKGSRSSTSVPKVAGKGRRTKRGHAGTDLKPG